VTRLVDFSAYWAVFFNDRSSINYRANFSHGNHYLIIFAKHGLWANFSQMYLGPML
jgi:hypothetical protein